VVSFVVNIPLPVVIPTGVVGGGAIAALVAVGMPPPPPPPPPPLPPQAARPRMSSVVMNPNNQVRFFIVLLPNKCALAVKRTAPGLLARILAETVV
jgi:hypothetical protein